MMRNYLVIGLALAITACGVERTPPSSSAASVTYEAEDALLEGATIETGVTDNALGLWYVKFQNPEQDSVVWTVNVPTSGNYLLEWGYAHDDRASLALRLEVNGQVAENPDITFVNTGAADAWSVFGQTTYLQAGENTVSLIASSDGGPDIDFLRVTPIAATYEEYPAEEAVLEGAIVDTRQRENETSTFVDYQDSQNGAIRWTIDTKTSGDYLLEWRYAIGSDPNRSLRLEINGELLDDPILTFGSTGKWSIWSSLTRIVSLEAGRNTIVLTAIGAGEPNIDYLRVYSVSNLPN